jgi:hypothetical protein
LLKMNISAVEINNAPAVSFYWNSNDSYLWICVPVPGISA